MAVQWETHRDAVVSAAKRSRSLDDLRNALSEHFGTRVTEDMTRNAWKRYQEKDPDLPKLTDMFVLAMDSVQELAEKCDKFVIPREAKPPEDAVESHAVHKGVLPRRVISDGDTHYPIHDPYVEAAKLAFARDVKPDAWVNVGDLWDAYLISKYAKEGGRLFNAGARLQEEFDSSRDYTNQISSLCPMHLILGNHENRLHHLLDANPGLFGLRALEWGRMAELPGNVTVHPYGTRLRIGAVTFEHGDQVNSRNPCSWLLDKRINRNTVFGHTHAMRTEYRTLYDEDGAPHSYVAINQGHGSLVAQQKYTSEPQWTHGFTYLELRPGTNGKSEFSAYPIAIVNGRFSFGGRTYDGKKWQ